MDYDQRVIYKSYLVECHYAVLSACICWRMPPRFYIYIEHRFTRHFITI